MDLLGGETGGDFNLVQSSTTQNQHQPVMNSNNQDLLDLLGGLDLGSGGSAIMEENGGMNLIMENNNQVAVALSPAVVPPFANQNQNNYGGGADFLNINIVTNGKL